ncbi:Hydrogen peroxide-induced 1 [Melia azedarach]|uniref:Hydrogen peroxide-induced 1 n=1 Tax=Melia azedarach TaxID=155640 RepID=A0ACC1YDZ9_MELAZ|nr:Hydrogen peroxide-induced 1 [Melia azedarach]
MAANWKSTGEIAVLGKRAVSGIFTRRPAAATATATVTTSHKRAAHTSAYDKNLDDQVHPTVVPDDVIQPQSEKYWAPHPQTGVFGPEAAGAGSGFNSSPATANGHNNSDSVLEEKAWFRPTSLEDLEKPHHQ